MYIDCGIATRSRKKVERTRRQCFAYIDTSHLFNSHTKWFVRYCLRVMFLEAMRWLAICYRKTGERRKMRCEWTNERTNKKITSEIFPLEVISDFGVLIMAGSRAGFIHFQSILLMRLIFNYYDAMTNQCYQIACNAKKRPPFHVHLHQKFHYTLYFLRSCSLREHCIPISFPLSD